MRQDGSVFWLALLVPLLSLWVERQPGLPDKTRLTGDFSERVQEYSKLRGKARSALPRLPRKAEPAQIAEHRRALAEAIRAARPNAQRGDIFTPPIAAEIGRIVRSETSGPGGRAARNATRVGNPAIEGDLRKFRMAVNAQYPGDQPVSMVPPGLLLTLPELPKGLEYRFVGRDLILLDPEAGLIVDFIPEVLP